MPPAEENSGFSVSFSTRQALVLFLLAGLAAGYAAGNVFPVETGGGTVDKEPRELQVSKIDNQGDPALGSGDAPVTMVLYEDFECPFCARFENRAFPRIKKNYVDTGKVRVVWKDFPLSRIHPWAASAAETMECVQRQDEEAFWKVKKRIYDNQKSLDTGNVETRIIGWASQQGVNSSRVRNCLEKGSGREEVREDLREGQSFEITVGGDPFVGGTPSAVIYREGAETGEPVVGAQPYSRFKTVIESQLEG